MHIRQFQRINIGRLRIPSGHKSLINVKNHKYRINDTVIKRRLNNQK